MEQKLLSVLLLLAVLCAGPCHALRLLNDADGGREFSFGSKAAAAGAAETEPLDPSLSDDYENEISHVEFEPELGSVAPHATAAAAPVPAAATTATVTVAAAGPAPEPVRARNAAAAESAAGTRSMKWWLPPSTMPSFPLFPNPGGMPGIPGLPMPGMPFHPIGGWGVPAPPDQSPPAPPAAAASTNANDPNANGGVN
ncbi:hypothetical protein SEVIR_9G066800v4 [Setaria viridis]